VRCPGLVDGQEESKTMLDLADRPRLGPYILTRELVPTLAFGLGDLFSPTVFSVGPSRLAQPDRYLALHASDSTSHVAYRFPAVPAGIEQRRFQAAAEHAAGLVYPHILRIQQVGLDTLSHPWLITPFTGDVDGLRTLAKLQKEKGGQFEPVEVERATEQLLSAAATAHAAGTPHGALSINEVLVDRHGCVLVELYGLARLLSFPAVGAGGGGVAGFELVRDEVRSIVEIAYQLITGLRAEEPIIPVGRIVPRLDPRWNAWFQQGLDPTRGFDTAQQALAALPGRVVTAPRLARVRMAFSRLRD